MASGTQYKKVAVAASTNTKVIAAANRTSSVKLIFVSSSTDATAISFAGDSATLTAGNGFPVLVAKSQGASGTNDWDLVPGEELWCRADQAGNLFIRQA